MWSPEKERRIGIGVCRVVVLSTFALLGGRLSGTAELVSALGVGEMLQDKAAAEGAVTRASDLNWTVVHAVRLTNGRTKVLPASATLRRRDSVSRADVARRLLSSVSDAGRFRQALVVAG